MNNFALSVIVPVYNHTEYASECLDSIIAQLEDNVELIIVDDGSDGETRDMLHAYENISDNISVYFETHRGASEARNAGIHSARGEYLCFIDCDDRMKAGSIATALALLKKQADLYIFGFTVLDMTGHQPIEEHRTLQDIYYSSVSDFADDYIRKRFLLIYSACNKLYRRDLLLQHQVFMPEGMCFGEDRMFNFAYLKTIRDVVTSSHEMFDYIIRSELSMSNRHIPDFFQVITTLNREKTDTFLQLSTGTTPEEKKAFIGQNFTECIECTLDRFDQYPEEMAENLPKINALAFGPAGLKLWNGEEISCTADLLLIFGCTWYELRAKAAVKYGCGKKDMIYVVTGGNAVHDSQETEAEAIRDYLIEHGIQAENIICENAAKNTVMNLEKSYPIICDLNEKNPGKIREIGLVTEGYHENYVRCCMEHSEFAGNFPYRLYPCFGIWANPDKWYLSESARRNILYNIKRIYVSTYLEEHKISE